MSDENNIKIVILGGARCGKTSILSKYFKNKFNEVEESTINPSFYQITVNHNEKNYRLTFYDTYGYKIFDAINTIYYNNCNGALLVYDVTIFETFQEVKDWVNTLREVVDKDLPIVILGNLFDLSYKNILDKNAPEIDLYCSKEHCKHFYTSAKTGFNIDEACETLINSIFTKLSNTIHVNYGRRGKKLEISDQSNQIIGKDKKNNKDNEDKKNNKDNEDKKNNKDNEDKKDTKEKKERNIKKKLLKLNKLNQYYNF